jgi:multiple sugar transport system permease protein
MDTTLTSPTHAAAPITPIGALARRAATLFVVHAILIVGAAFILLPFVWMLITSNKSTAEIFAVDFSLLPKHFNAV